MSSMLINLFAFWAAGHYFKKLGLSDNHWWKIIRGIFLIALGWLLLTAFGYLLTPLFFDHGESTLASIAANWLRGGEMYTKFDSPDQYTLLYGPWPIIVVAGFLKLGSETIVLAKLPGVLNLGFSLLIFYWMVGRLNLSLAERLIAIGTFSASMLGFYNTSYFIRPDSFLLINMVLAMWAVEWLPSRIGVYAILGILAGLSFNCKINAPIYFVPLCVYYLERGKGRWSLLAFVTTIILSLLGAGFPFALPHVSALEFWHWINLPWVGEGTTYPILDAVKGITYGAAFMFVLWALGMSKRYPWSFWTLAGITIVVGIISGTPGSWVHMYLPIMPFYIWLAAESYSALDLAERKKRHLMLAAMLLTFALNGINRQKRMVELFGQTPRRWREYKDLQRLAEGITEPIELGYGSTEQYESSFYKPWFVHHGHGYFLDACALMKITYSGVPIPKGTLEKIEDCKVPYMILPKGNTAWTVENFYTHKPLFPEALKASLLSHYSPVKSGDYYDLYVCHK